MLVVYRDLFASLFLPSAEAQGIAVCSDPKQMNSAPDEKKSMSKVIKVQFTQETTKNPPFVGSCSKLYGKRATKKYNDKKAMFRVLQLTFKPLLQQIRLLQVA